MSKELEALDRMSIHRFDEEYEEWDKDYETVENYLESIDQANPSEALKDLRICWAGNQSMGEYISSTEYEHIEQALLKAQEQEKDIKNLKFKLELIQDERVHSAKHHIQLQKNIDKFKNGYSELEKVLNIIFEKGLSLVEKDMIKQSENYEQYQIKISWWNYKPFAIPKSKEEFDLLKRYFDRKESE